MSGTRGDRRRRRASRCQARCSATWRAASRSAECGPDEERLRGGQREQAIVGDAPRDAPRRCRRPRPRGRRASTRSRRRAARSSRIGARSSSSALVGDADDDRVDLEVEAGLTDREDVRSRAEMARRDVPARTGERLLELGARLRSEAATMTARRGRMSAPRCRASHASPPAARWPPGRSARRARRGPRGPRRRPHRWARCSPRGVSNGLRADR